jgi:hypothetical protein
MNSAMGFLAHCWFAIFFLVREYIAEKKEMREER